MTLGIRFLIGGLGAVLPIFINLLAIDASLMFVNFNLVAFAGYCVRCIVLFGAGGVSTIVWKEEVDFKKLIQLGMAAPSLLLALNNGIKVESPRIQTSAIYAVNEVYASEIDSPIPIKDFNKELPSEFSRGFFLPADAHFVVVAQFSKEAEAISFYNKNIQKLTKLCPSLAIYKPLLGKLQWTLVAGEKLEHADAKKKRDELKKEGFKDTEVWSALCECVQAMEKDE